MKASQSQAKVEPPAKRTILVVDDEADVLGAIRDTLEGPAYRLIVTTDPHFAFETLRGNKSIELLIADLFMPAMNGATLLHECRQIRPGLHAILTTGAASAEQLRAWRLRGETIVLKPWLDDELTVAVQKALACEPNLRVG